MASFEIWREMRILTLTSLFPNAAMPRHGVFVRERLHQLVTRHHVECSIIAPVPWFPLARTASQFHRASVRIPRSEQQNEFRVDHPRFLAVPLIGRVLNPLAYAYSVMRWLSVSDVPEFDLIDAHYAFPDGVAAVLLAHRLNKPVVVTVRGSDINLHSEEFGSRWWLRRALVRCGAVVAVSHALAEKVRMLEPRIANRVCVVPNGVDQGVFRVLGERDAIRSRMRLSGLVLISIGNLVELKGHHQVIEALELLTSATLIIIGDGPQQRALREKAQACGVANRVRFIGNVSQHDLVDYYNAGDVLVNASSSEGLPNVVLESLACGTPVVATRVGGLPEVVRSDAGGVLIDRRDPTAIAEGVRAVVGAKRSRDAVRGEIEKFDWARTSDNLFQLFNRLIRQGAVPTVTDAA